MVGFDTEVKLGNNDAIELTLINQAWISESKDGGICVDLEIGIFSANKYLKYFRYCFRFAITTLNLRRNKFFKLFFVN